MRRAAILRALVAFSIASAGLAGPAVDDASATPRTGTPSAAHGQRDGRFVVVLDRAAPVDTLLGDFGRRLGVRARHAYGAAMNGFSAALTQAQVTALRDHPAVRMVVPDRAVTLDAQTLPTSADRVEADRSPTARIDGVEGAVDVDIAIIDTGVDRTHPDLNVVGGEDCVGGVTGAWDDVHGHGTHVAGVAAARDNGFGVVGIAPGARIWSLRVFDESGLAYTSSIVCAIDWITAQRDRADASRPLIEVANMSMTGPGYDDLDCGATAYDAEHTAICASVAAGTAYVAAAGNDGTDAEGSVPAAYDEVITVSALTDYNGRGGGGAASTCGGSSDADDTFADYSNHGADIDLMAPGTCVLSTLRGGSYGRMSGTSMAAPAVAGAAALYRATHPGASPAEVRAALQAAGSNDWAASTDPDATHERLLDVSSFGAPPAFSFTTTSTLRTIPEAGGSAEYGVELVRGNGFSAPVDFAVTGLPSGGTGVFTLARSAGPGQLSSSLVVTAGDQTPAGAYTLTLTATSGSSTVTRAVRLVKQPWDTSPPAMRAPSAALVTGSTLGATTVPVLIRWSATDPGGIARYELQQSADSGAWTTVTLPSPTAVSMSRSVTPGHSYRFRARATDRAGNASAWVTGTTVTLGAYQENIAAIAYGGSWIRQASSAAYGGYVRTTTAAGATARLSFTGRAVAWVAPRTTTSGQAYVTVDGVRVATVDLRASSASSRRTVFTRSWSSAGSHSIEIRVIGTSGRPRVDVDALVVLR